MKILKILVGLLCFGLTFNTLSKGINPIEGFFYYLPSIIVFLIGVLLLTNVLFHKNKSPNILRNSEPRTRINTNWIIFILLSGIVFVSFWGLNYSNHKINFNELNDGDTIYEKIEGFSSSTYNTYCNNRFSFCLEYPLNFIPNGESGNGDGQSFTSQDGNSTISSWGSLVLEEISTLDIDYEYELEKYKTQITYKKKGSNYYVVSGINDGKVFYTKAVQKKIDYFDDKNTDVVIVYHFTYPVNQRKQYDAYCNKINNDLR